MKDDTTLTSIFKDRGIRLKPDFQFGEDMGSTEKYGHVVFAASIKKLLNEKEPVKIKLEPVYLTFSPGRANFFGLTFRQTAHAGNQQCDGYVFVLIEKRSGSQIFLHCRTWQPDSPDGTPVPPEEVFNFYDFFIP